MPIPDGVLAEFKERYSAPSSPYREAFIFLPMELQQILVRERVVGLGQTNEPDELQKEAWKRVRGRLKDYSRTLEKAERRGIDVQSIEEFEKEIGDIVGARVVVDFLHEQYDTLRVIETHRRFRILEIQDYVKDPQSSGYRGLHVKIQLDTPSFRGVVCEIQVKTSTQDAWAERTHDLIYKADQIDAVWGKLAKMQSDCLHHTDEAFEIIREEVQRLRGY